MFDWLAGGAEPGNEVALACDDLARLCHSRGRAIKRGLRRGIAELQQGKNVQTPTPPGKGPASAGPANLSRSKRNARSAVWNRAVD
jgi:hypothetical protein